MRRKVTRVRLHDLQVVIPGIGSLDKELPPTNKTVKVDMYLDSEYPGVLVATINNTSIFIPLANIQIGFLAPEDTK